MEKLRNFKKEESFLNEKDSLQNDGTVSFVSEINKVYAFNKKESNFIRYTASEKIFVDPSTFNSDIVSHEYNDGIGVITFNEELTSIGNGAFSWCESLTSITIPNSVTSIGNDAFEYCHSLSEITIPNSVTEIGGGVFYNCTSLSSITIGNSVTSIGDWAFASCYSLREITCLAETEPIVSSNTFRGICYNGILYYPQGSDYSSWLSTSDYYLGYHCWNNINGPYCYDEGYGDEGYDEGYGDEGYDEGYGDE